MVNPAQSTAEQAGQKPLAELTSPAATSLPSRAKSDTRTSEDALPPPGHALTGKQEHCECIISGMEELGE